MSEQFLYPIVNCIILYSLKGRKISQNSLLMYSFVSTFYESYLFKLPNGNQFTLVKQKSIFSLKSCTNSMLNLNTDSTEENEALSSGATNVENVFDKTSV
jgi:hypothetical protein